MLIPAQWFAHTQVAAPAPGVQARVPGHDAAGQGDGRGAAWASAWRAAQASSSGTGGTAAATGAPLPAATGFEASTSAGHMPGMVRLAGSVMRGPDTVHARACDPGEPPVPQLAATGRRAFACAALPAPRPGALGRALPPPCAPPPERSCVPHVHVEIVPGQVRLWLGLPAAWGGSGAADHWLAGVRALVPAGVSCKVVCNGHPIGTASSAVPSHVTEERSPWN